MRRTSMIGILSFAPVMLIAGGAAAQSPAERDAIADRDAIARVVPQPFRDASCSLPGSSVHCFSKIRTDDRGALLKFAAASGLGPPDFQAAYKLPTTGGNGKTIGIVDAYHYANAEADLAQYRTQYGLPPCTTANGCFKVVDENGGTTFPSPDPQGCQGWNGEASLDLDMASAACPDCKILLVEISSASGNFGAGVSTAVKLGAVAVSNSYGGPEDATVAQQEADYTHAGVWITASAGDNGYGASYPATGAGVLAVGGTTLTKSSSSRGWAEAAWNGTGSGCSAFVAKPSWQNDNGCTFRMEADVSADADPNTGAAVYCSGWQQVGGTSESAPLVAAALLVLGVTGDPSYPWKNPTKFFDVTSGSNGSCTSSYECNAGTGYDGPTGWGSPNGALLLTGSSSGSGSGGSSGSSSGSSSGGGSGGSSGGSSGSGSGGSSGSGSGGSSGSGSGSGSSSGSGGSSGGGSGSSSGGVNTGIPDAGADSSTGANNDANWNPSSPSGCGCTVIESREGYGGLAIGLGLVAGWSMRRRRGSKAAS